MLKNQIRYTFALLRCRTTHNLYCKVKELGVSFLQGEKSSQVIEVLNKSVAKSEIDETVKIKALMILSIVYSNLSEVPIQNPQN